MAEIFKNLSYLILYAKYLDRKDSITVLKKLEIVLKHVKMIENELQLEKSIYKLI